ncbi:hypothetical protein KSF78_0001206 [Schistosoma japonicum]|nr:hypothetical protein KSF78_0001206 [Schistosoma japonicum]
MNPINHDVQNDDGSVKSKRAPPSRSYQAERISLPTTTPNHRQKRMCRLYTRQHDGQHRFSQNNIGHG